MTEMLVKLNVEECVQCGLVDDDPKVHIAEMQSDPDRPGEMVWIALTRHTDCVSVKDKAAIFAGGHSQHVNLTANIFKKSEDGLRGGDLREFIQKQKVRDHGNAKAMAKAVSYANDILDAGFNGTATGTFVLGATTYTYPLRCIFMSTLSVAATQGTEWGTSGGYTAGGVSLSGLFGTAAASAAKANTGAVTVTNAPAQTWADNEVKDSTGTPKRMNFKGTPSLGKTVNSGDTCTIATGAFTTSEV